MKQFRRSFIVTLASSLGLVSKIIEKKDNYYVKYQCDFKDGKTINDFYRDRLNWEKPEKVTELIEMYKSEGRILNISNTEAPGHIAWAYTFNVRSDFESFNKEVFLLGYFDQAKIHPSYIYKLSENV